MTINECQFIIMYLIKPPCTMYVIIVVVLAPCIYSVCAAVYSRVINCKYNFTS